MDVILDANTIVYLVKTNLFHKFVDCLNKPIIIDTSVYKEVVIDGIKNNYSDAHIAKKYIEDYNIPIIPTDISTHLPLFRDPGETSCYILASKRKSNSLIISSDIRALKKFVKFGFEPLALDEFFFNICKNGIITIQECEEFLNDLQSVFATTETRKSHFLSTIRNE